MSKTTFLLLLLILFCSSTPAQQGRDMEKEKAIWAELETMAPESLADFKAATEALDAQDFEKAAELYLAVHQVGSSRVDLQACKLEYSIVSPK